MEDELIGDQACLESTADLAGSGVRDLRLPRIDETCSGGETEDVAGSDPAVPKWTCEFDSHPEHPRDGRPTSKTRDFHSRDAGAIPARRSSDSLTGTALRRVIEEYSSSLGVQSSCSGSRCNKDCGFESHHELHSLARVAELANASDLGSDIQRPEKSFLPGSTSHGTHAASIAAPKGVQRLLRHSSSVRTERAHSSRRRPSSRRPPSVSASRARSRPHLDEFAIAEHFDRQPAFPENAGMDEVLAVRAPWLVGRSLFLEARKPNRRGDEPRC